MLSARQLVRQFIKLCVKRQLPGHVLQALFAFAAVDPFLLQTKFNILFNRQMRKQGVGLKTKRGVPVLRRRQRDIFIGNFDSSVGGLQKAGNKFQQRCFPAAGRTQQGDKLAFFDTYRNVFERRKIPKAHLQTVNINRTHVVLLPRRKRLAVARSLITHNV